MELDLAFSALSAGFASAVSFLRPRFYVLIGALVAGMFTSPRVAFAEISNSDVVNVETLKGQPLRSYPKLMHVSHTALSEIYWANEEDCASAPALCDQIVDQQIVKKIQIKLETSVFLKVADFDKLGRRLFSNWDSELKARLFPISFKIQLGDEMQTAGSIFDTMQFQTFKADGSLINEGSMHSRISIGSRSAAFSAVDTLALHEFGHMVLRTLNFPQLTSPQSGRIDSLFEEMLADFIGSMTNSDTPYMAPGLQQSAKQFAIDQLSSPDADNFQHAMMEGHLRGISDKALRDFTKTYSYSDVYLLPGHYVSSIFMNSVFYRIKQILTPQLVDQTMLLMVAHHSSFFTSGDEYDLIHKFLLFYAQMHRDEFNHQRQALKKLFEGYKLKPAVRGTENLHLDTTENDDLSKSMVISPNKELIEKLFKTTMRSITYTIYLDAQPKFALTQFLDYTEQQKLRFVPIDQCDQLSSTCLCGVDSRRLSVDGVYLSQSKEISGTKTVYFNLPKTGVHSCYKLSFDWF